MHLFDKDSKLKKIFFEARGGGGGGGVREVRGAIVIF